jgi:hypothetical protein
LCSTVGRVPCRLDDGGALRMDPAADDPGLPEWLKHLGHRDGTAAGGLPR